MLRQTMVGRALSAYGNDLVEQASGCKIGNVRWQGGKLILRAPSSPAHGILDDPGRSRGRHLSRASLPGVSCTSSDVKFTWLRSAITTILGKNACPENLFPSSVPLPSGGV